MTPSVPFLASLLGSFFVDGANATASLSDDDLWDRILSDSDTLRGMSLQEAIRVDPRRVDARLQQAILNPMRRAIQEAMTTVVATAPGYDGLMKAAWLEAARSRSLDVMVENLDKNLALYIEVLRVVMQMKSERARAIQRHLVDRRDEIGRGFREAAEILDLAHDAAPDEEQAELWTKYAGLVRAMHTETMTLLGAP